MRDRADIPARAHRHCPFRRLRQCSFIESQRRHKKRRRPPFILEAFESKHLLDRAVPKMCTQTIGKVRPVLVRIADFSSLPPGPRHCLDIRPISEHLGVDVARHASPIFLHPSLDHVAPVFDNSRTAEGSLGREKWGAAQRPPRKQTWNIPFGVSELGGDVVGCALRNRYCLLCFDGTAVFPFVAHPVDVKKGDQQCETVSQPSIRPDKEN